VVFSWIVNRKKFRAVVFRTLPLAKSIAIFYAVAFLSIFRVIMVSKEDIALQNSVWFLLRLFEYLSVYFIVGSMNLTNNEREGFSTLILYCGLIVSIVGLLQYWNILGAFAPTRYIAVEGPLTGTFTFKAHIGAVMMVLILLVIDKIVQQRINSLVGFSMAGIFSVVLVFTESRSAWLATLIAIICYLLVLRRTKLLVYGLVTILVIGSIVLSSKDLKKVYIDRPIIDLNTGKISQDLAVQSRLSGYSSSMSYLTKHPDIFLFGVGFSNWRYALYSSSLLYNGHNNYLTALGELGLAGFLFFWSVWFTAIKTAVKRVKYHQPFACFYLSLTVGLLVAACFEDLLWPAVALESFLAFVMFISALSFPSLSIKRTTERTKAAIFPKDTTLCKTNL